MDAVAQDLRARGFKGFLSIAQLRRCDSLVTAGTIAKEVFERDLLATDIENTPWRKGPAKEDDGSEEFQAEYRKVMIERRQGLAAAIPTPSNQEGYNPQGEGLQEGGEGLEAGRP